MNIQRRLKLGVLCLILFCLNTPPRWALAEGPGPLPDRFPSEPQSVRAVTGTTFTYQGRLRQDLLPYSGTCDMTFELFDDPSSGTPISGTITTTTPVASGLFIASLDFGNAAFTGGARWLQIGVRCPTGAVDPFTTLAPRQALSAVPYAISLAPGAVISSATTFATISTGGSGLRGTSVVSNGVGVAGYATVDTGLSWGMFGQTYSDAGYGVFGYASAISGTTYGVRGRSDSVNGLGVYGSANALTGLNYGMYGRASSVNGIGVYGVVDSSNATTTVGVLGQTNGTCQIVTCAIGVKGMSANGEGVVGVSDTRTGVVAISRAGNPIEAYGATTPTRVFAVTYTGTVYADGSFNCGLTSGSCFNAGIGADVAERIDAREALPPGSVVEIDPDHPGAYRLSQTAFSPLVVGVISTQPAMTLNNTRRDARPLLALVGQVPVRVSAENGPIRPGDLLVAASRPGYAMRAGDNPPPGTIIGKAIGALARDTGEIMLLVMLR